MDNLKRAFGLMLICLTANGVMAQDIYKGRVIDSKGEPLTGATVMEVGTKNGAVTDINGNFTITLHNPRNLLHVSFVGFQDQDVKAKKTLSSLLTRTTIALMSSSLWVTAFKRNAT